MISEPVRKIGVLEWICGGGIRNFSRYEISASFVREGADMLLAVLAEIEKLASTQAVTLYDPAVIDISGWKFDNVQIHSITADISTIDQWIQIAQSCDTTIVIAPEFDNCLIQVLEAMRAAGCELWNCEPPFLHAASDKWQTAAALRSASIPHPETYLLADWVAGRVDDNSPDLSPPSGRSIVIKRRDGAGCDGMVITDRDSPQAIQHFLNQPNIITDQWLVQTYVPGRAASISAICGPERITFFPPRYQEMRETPISNDLRPDYNADNKTAADSSSRELQYLGPGELLPQQYWGEIEDLARQAIQACGPGAIGWVGVDFLIRYNADESNDHSTSAADITIIEINPRLTTSFTAVRQACLRPIFVGVFF